MSEIAARGVRLIAFYFSSTIIQFPTTEVVPSLVETLKEKISVLSTLCTLRDAGSVESIDGFDAAMQKFQFPIAFHSPELSSVPASKPRGCPAHQLVPLRASVSRCAHSLLDGSEQARLDGVGGGQGSAQQPAHTEPVDRQRFLHTLLPSCGPRSG